jgi:hypothetical protein
MATITPEERSAFASIAGLTSVARQGPDLVAARARKGLRAKFEKEADPEGLLDPEERARRADLLVRAHMRRIILKRWRDHRSKGGDAA